MLEVLKKAHVKVDITPENLAKIVGQIMAPRVKPFSDDEIPPEGTGHTNALYIAVDCRGLRVPAVLIDNGSGLNVCTLNTVKALGLGKADIRKKYTKAFKIEIHHRRPIGHHIARRSSGNTRGTGNAGSAACRVGAEILIVSV